MTFDALGFRDWRAQTDREIVGEMVSADWHSAGVTHDPTTIHNQFGGAAADVEQTSTEVAFVLSKASLRGGQRLDNGVADQDSGAIRGGNEILRRSHRRCDDVYVSFEALAHHADGVTDSIVRVHRKFVRQYVQNFAVLGKRDVAGGINRAANIFAFDIARTIAKRDAATAVQSAHMASGDTDQRRFNWNAGNAFGFFDGTPNGADSSIQIDNGTFAQAFRFGSAQRQKFQLVVGKFGDQDAGLSAANIESDEIFIFFRQSPPPPLSLLFLLHRHVLTAAARIRIQDHLARILQIHGLYAASIGLPLRKIVDQHSVFSSELVSTEVNRNRLRRVDAGNAGHYHAKVARIAEIDFADMIGRAGPNQVGVPQEFLKGLHAFLAVGVRDGVRKAGDNREMEVLAARPIENFSEFVDQGDLAAITYERDRRALGNINANAVRQNSLNAGGLYPGDFFDIHAARVERNAQHAVPAVLVERRKHRFTRDDVIAGHFHLLRLEQQNFRR